MYNLLIGGAAGDGIETMAGVLEKMLKRKGYYLFSMRDFMSRVRGGHNFAKIRFGKKPVHAHRDTLDGLVVLNAESLSLHQKSLSKDAFVLCDTQLGLSHKKAVGLPMRQLARLAGNEKAMGTVAIGALLALFGLGGDGAEDVLRQSLAEKLLPSNLAALRLGFLGINDPPALAALLSGQNTAIASAVKKPEDLAALFGTATSAANPAIPDAESLQALLNTQALSPGSSAHAAKRIPATPAIKKGPAPKSTSPKKNKAESLLLTGAEAMSLGAIAGGLRFYSAYPMSPSSTLLEYFSTHAETFRLGVEQAEDEIAAINMALGAAYAGAPAMVGTSGGGFSLMVEALGFAGIAEIPLVVANIMRPGPSTGLPTRTEQSDLGFVIHASQGEFPRMVIAVRDHTDAFHQTARALRIAWQYQIPVILLGDQYLADAAATIAPFDVAAAQKNAEQLQKSIDTSAPTGEYHRYAITPKGISPLRIPGQGEALVRVDSDEHDESGTITESAQVRVAQTNKRMHKLKMLQKELAEPSYTGPKEPKTLLVGFGTTAPALSEAVKKLNKDAAHTGALCFGDVWPLPKQKLRRLAQSAATIVNVEQNATGQLARLLRSEAGIACDASILKYDGRQLSVDDILRGVAKLK